MRRRTLLRWFGGLLAAIVGSTRPAPVRAQSSYPPPMPPGRRAEWDRMRARVLAALPYPRIEVPGERALAEWERLRAEGRGWPVIVGDDEQLDALAEQFSLEDQAVFPMPPGAPSPFGDASPPTPAAILAEAATLSFPESLAHWSGNDPELPEPPLGEWPAPGAVEGSGLTVASDILSGESFPLVHILLIPTTRSWEVPAYLRWGNWNACPPPAQHVAALRRWHERFGVELVGINRDTLNLRAARRPADRAVALALGLEHYSYCPDVIDQGVGSLSALAAMLMANDWWYFGGTRLLLAGSALLRE